MPFVPRPGTIDDVVYRQVVIENEYGVPEQLPADAIVVDIGVHVGAFSHLALSRGAARVYGFEPERGNFEQAARNLTEFGPRFEIQNRAVWRSDLDAKQLHFWPSSDAANTGGGTLIWDTDGPIVDAIRFDDAIDEITLQGKRRIALLKIDCEGAEFPILMTSSRLDRIDRIVGEYHELRSGDPLPPHVRMPGVDEFSRDVLVAALTRSGFSVETKKLADGQYGEMGLFDARRPAARASVSGWLRKIYRGS